MLKEFKAQFLIKPFFRRSLYCAGDGKACIVLDIFNFVLERVTEWLIINGISIVKMILNKNICRKSLKMVLIRNFSVSEFVQ